MAVHVRKERYASARRCGARITEGRKAQRLTLKPVAVKTGFSPQQIFLVEKGEINTPIETLTRIAEGLGVSIATWVREEAELLPLETHVAVSRCAKKGQAALKDLTSAFHELHTLVAR